MKCALNAGLLAGISLFAATAAHAQQADKTDESANAAVEAEGIVVTGSRVATNENSPTPLTVLSTDQFLKLQPTTVTDALTLMPALLGSQNTSSRPGGGQRNGAAANLSLRNMGDLRTLILFDGQRVTPTINSNNAQVDSSIIPQLLIKRVDVVTGGVSAVYGSDGVSGTINFITDRAFNGIKVQANTGVSTYGDAKTWDAGIAAGTSFSGGRGHVEFSYQHMNDQGLPDRRDALERDFFRANTGQAGNGSVANPYFNIPDMRISNATFGGLVLQSSLASISGLQFTSPTSLAAFNHGLIPLAGGSLLPFGSTGTLASTNVESGGDGAYYASSSIKHKSSFDQAFGRIDFDLTDDIHFFAQLSYSSLSNANQFRSPAFIANNATGNLRFNFRNPYLWGLATYGPQIQALANTGTMGMNILINNAPRSRNETEAWMAQTGFEGKLGDKANWTLSFSKQQSVLNSIDPFNFRRDKFAAALDAVDVGLVTNGVANGQIACNAALTYTGHAANPNFAGCVPLNLFGGVSASNAAAWNWLYESTFNKQKTRLETINASITAEPFNTGAGPVKVALSGEYRRIRWDVESNADPLDLVANCDGISLLNGSTTARLNCVAPIVNSAGVVTNTATTRWFNNSFGAISGAKQNVKEGAIEIQVPLIAGKRFIEDFSITGALRLTDYSTSGSVTTWKLGANWQVSDDLRLRATRSRDIRAPNLFELFSSVKQNCGANVVDPLTNTTFLNVCNIERPNPNLSPEIGNTLTIGAVLTPKAIPGLSLSVDYYQIKMSNVIFLVQGFNAGVLANCLALKGASQLCSDVVTRANWTDTSAVTNPITKTESVLRNIASQTTWGFDFEAGYKTQIAGHNFDIRALVAYQPKLDYDQGPVGVLTMAGAYNVGTNRFGATPKWRMTAIASFDVTDNINFTWLQRWRSGLRAYYDPAIALVQPEMPQLGTSTVNLSYKFEKDNLGKGEVFFNVKNLFNKFPTVYYSGQITQPSSQPFTPEGDDAIGRYFSVGLRLKI